MFLELATRNVYKSHTTIVHASTVDGALMTVQLGVNNEYIIIYA